ncbi:MAG: Kae1-associated serine/threonine protein kinase [archaeon]|nr:MAG: Kae1-associated serine/threonine protein kinase [archaeon]
MKIIAQGAEAILIRKGNSLIKDRIKKGYRHKNLDLMLRKRRTKRESRLLEKTSKMVDVPKIKKTSEFQIEMEFLSGKKLSEWLDKLPKTEAFRICKEIGKNLAILHKNNIIHGDLTTSNMILRNRKVYFIDFGLGFHSARVEDKAVDLYLLAQALKSKHFKSWQNYLKEVIKTYRKGNENVLKQLKKVETRGRYKSKNGTN